MSFKCTCTQRLSCAPPICVRSHFCHHISLVDEHKQKDKMRYIHDYYIHVYNNIYFVICVCAIQSTVFRNLVSDITIEDFFGFDFGNPSHFFLHNNYNYNMAQNCYFSVRDYVTSTMNHLVRVVYLFT